MRSGKRRSIFGRDGRCGGRGSGDEVKFQEGFGDWVQYKALSPAIVIVFHRSDSGPREKEYWEVMNEIEAEALEAIQRAQREGIPYVLFRHGWSTSGPFKETARSRVRGLMRSTAATPYIVRRECIQHESVFVAAIRPAKGEGQ